MRAHEFIILLKMSSQRGVADTHAGRAPRASILAPMNLAQILNARMDEAPRAKFDGVAAQSLCVGAAAH